MAVGHCRPSPLLYCPYVVFFCFFYSSLLLFIIISIYTYIICIYIFFYTYLYFLILFSFIYSFIFFLLVGGGDVVPLFGVQNGHTYPPKGN